MTADGAADSGLLLSVELVSSVGDSTDEFVKLLAKHQRGLYGFLVSLVGSTSDADDLMQEVSLAVWRKFPQFDPTRDFFRWACGIAHIEVLRYRHRKATDRHWFDESVLELIAEEFVRRSDRVDERREALTACLDTLNAAEREILNRRYFESTPVASLAKQTQTSASTLQKRLASIRRRLQKCVTARIAQMEHH